METLGDVAVFLVLDVFGTAFGVFLIMGLAKLVWPRWFKVRKNEVNARTNHHRRAGG